MLNPLLFVALSVAAPQKATPWQQLPLIHDWYGVYLQGRKVGYLESKREKRSTPAGSELYTEQRMVARVAGMGQSVEVSVTSSYSFDWATGKMTGLSFKQTSPTGAVSVVGKSVGGKLDMTFEAGGERRTLPNEKDETVAEHQAAELLARDSKAKVGAKRSIRAFDPSIQKVSATELVLTKIEKRVLDGVEVPVRHINSKMLDLGVEEESVLTPDGRILEARVAGLFTIRVEDEKRARDLDYSQDVLVAFVVPVDKPIADPYRLENVAIHFTGAGGYKVPQNERQMVKGSGDAFDVYIRRPTIDPMKAAALPVDTSKFAAELKPEPLLQSDAPEIRALAREIVGNERNSFKAAERLLQWVYRKVEKAYVPAVSNALEVYKSRKGDCGEHAALFVALARAAGIPARPVVGITYWPPGNGFGYHAWAEVWVGQWIAVDPTQGTMAADATHVQLAGGDLAEQAKITSLIGKLKARIDRAL